MIRLIKRFLADEAGATAIEYAIIAGGISVAIVTIVSQIGTSVNSKFQSVTDAVK